MTSSWLRTVLLGTAPVAIALALIACGSRTRLDQASPPSSPRDGGVRDGGGPDGGPRDAGRRDAGLPTWDAGFLSCAFDQLSTIFEVDRGYANAPTLALVPRAFGFDLSSNEPLAFERGMVRRIEVRPPGRADVRPVGVTLPLGAPDLAVLGDTLVATHNTENGPADVVGYALPYDATWSWRLGAPPAFIRFVACNDNECRGSVSEGNDRPLSIAEFSPTTASPGQVAFQQSTRTLTGLTDLTDGFAWVSDVDPAGTVEVVIARNGEMGRHFSLVTSRLVTGQPAIARWPFAPREVVVALPPEADAPLVRVSAEGMIVPMDARPDASMFSERPVAEATLYGLAVAYRSYGDILPLSGFIQVGLVDASGAAQWVEIGPVNGPGDMALAETNGMTLLVWSEPETRSESGPGRIRGVVLGCIEE